MQLFAKWSALWVIDGNFTYIEFYFSSNFDLFFFLWIDCWEFLVVCWQISFISYNFWDKLKRQTRAKFQNLSFLFFSFNFNAFICKMLIFISYNLDNTVNELFFMDNRLNGASKFCKFVRYTQSIFFTLLWHVWYIDCLKSLRLYLSRFVSIITVFLR